MLADELQSNGDYEQGMSDKQFKEFELDPSVKAIVNGFSLDLNFRQLAVASMYLQKEGVKFVTTNYDPVFIAGRKNKRKMPDTGSTLAALETASGRTAVRVGKPDVFALGAILEDHFKD